MLPSISLETFRFASPVYLWMLLAPIALLFLWGWRVVRRRADVRRLAAQRIVPVKQRFGPVGDLAFWRVGDAERGRAVGGVAVV